MRDLGDGEGVGASTPETEPFPGSLPPPPISSISFFLSVYSDIFKPTLRATWSSDSRPETVSRAPATEPAGWPSKPFLITEMLM